MPFITTSDDAQIFYKDWGSGQPVVFSHGWPLTSDVWDNQLMLVADRGFRGIAHDRRGGGRSSQTWAGNDLDQYADDLATLIETLDLHDAVLVGHSTGGGEVTRYLGRHGTSRVAKAVLVGAIPPLMLKTETNPRGLRPGGEGGAGGRDPAADAEDRNQPARPADGGVRSVAYRDGQGQGPAL